MKKFLKIAGITIISLLVIILIIPFLFKNQIKEKVEEEINKNINAKVHFESLSLNLIRSFPDFYMSLNGLTVVGIDDFSKDTLVAFKSFSTRLDLMSVIKMKDIKVKAIILDSPVINGIILKNGKSNWDISKPSTDTTTNVDTAKSAPMAFKVSLKKFAIKNANISYTDNVSGMKANMKNFNFDLSGDMSSDFTTINILTTTEAINFSMNGISYLKNATNHIKIAVDADMKNMSFTLKENEFVLNALDLAWDGKISMKDSTITADVKFNTKRTDFKSLLSMVPAVFLSGFESVKTDGTLKLDGYIKGDYNGKSLPNAGLELQVNNAFFKYPDLPKSVDNINIDLKVFFDGVQNDNTTVDLNKFHLEIANNPIDFVFNLKTPISDPSINGKFVGNIDLGSLADVVPLDSTTILGRIETNLDFMGKLSMIEQQKYEDFKADGSVILTGFQFKSPDLKQGANIEKAAIQFSPKFVELSTFDMQVGKSDIHLNGKLTNFIPFALKGETVHGNLDFSSNVIDLNEFMGTSVPDTVQQVEDTAQLSTVEVPKNIDFTLSSKISKLIFDKLEVTNIAGLIKVTDGKLAMEKLFMNLLQGSMIMTGEYNTQDMAKPMADFMLDIKEIDIPSSFEVFNTVKKLAPIAENAKGKVSVNLAFVTLMDAHMSPMLNTMNGQGKLSSKEIEIMNSKTFNKIADALKNNKFKNVKVNDINLSFQIKDGRIYVDPFDTKVLGYKANISGDQGLDQTMNYLMKVAISRKDLGAADKLLSGLGGVAGSAANVVIGDVINANVSITGTFTDSKVGVSLGNSEGKSMKEAAKEEVKKVIDEKKAEIKEDLSKKADELIAKAQKEADAVKASAKKAADLVRKESKDRADQLVKEAGSNPLKKTAAKEAAKKVQKEGEEKAKKIEDEGNSKADAIMKKAKDEAAKLK